LYALVVEPNGITGIFVNDLARAGLPPVSEGVFQGLPVELVFGHLPESVGSESDLSSPRGYALKAGQLTYDCRYSTMHGMPVTGGCGFRGLKPLWYNGVPP